MERLFIKLIIFHFQEFHSLFNHQSRRYFTFLSGYLKKPLAASNKYFKPFIVTCFFLCGHSMVSTNYVCFMLIFNFSNESYLTYCCNHLKNINTLTIFAIISETFLRERFSFNWKGAIILPVTADLEMIYWKIFNLPKYWTFKKNCVIFLIGIR